MACGIRSTTIVSIKLNNIVFTFKKKFNKGMRFDELHLMNGNANELPLKSVPFQGNLQRLLYVVWTSISVNVQQCFFYSEQIDGMQMNAYDANKKNANQLTEALM